MRKNLNKETIEGRIYNHNLTKKTVQNKQSENFGKEFITGTISIATDEAGINIIPIHYTYITEITKNGKADSRFNALTDIMEGKTWVKDGKETAPVVRVTPQAALNDFYPQGNDNLVSQPINEGGFISTLTELNKDESKRRMFEFDTVITGINIIEKENEPEYAEMKCAIFNFKNDILPFKLTVRKPEAITYFMSLDISEKNPVYTLVKGEIINLTIKKEKVVHGAFGDSVEFVNSNVREWVVTWANPEPYIFGEEDTITAEDFQRAIANRNVYLETVKTRAKEYYNEKGSISAESIAKNSMPTPTSQIPEGGFSF